MTPPHLPGNEPDSGDMSTDPDLGPPGLPDDGSLADDEAEKLGNFA